MNNVDDRNHTKRVVYRHIQRPEDAHLIMLLDHVEQERRRHKGGSANSSSYNQISASRSLAAKNAATRKEGGGGREPGKQQGEAKLNIGDLSFSSDEEDDEEEEE